MEGVVEKKDVLQIVGEKKDSLVCRCICWGAALTACLIFWDKATMGGKLNSSGEMRQEIKRQMENEENEQNKSINTPIESSEEKLLA